MLDAHMDEVALIVTSIQSDGTLTVDTVGGVDASVVIGRQVIVGSEKLAGVAGAKAIHKLSKEMNVRKSLRLIVFILILALKMQMMLRSM